MTRYKKRIIAGLLAFVLTLGMTACKSEKNEYESGISKEGGYSEEEASTTKAMVIGDYDIYMDEMIMYAMQVIYMQGYTSANWSEQVESTQKETVLSLIRQNKVIYDYAVKYGTELNDDDLAYVQNMIDGFKNRFDGDLLDKYGISDEVINKVFEEQAVVSKFETEVKNDIGQTLQDEFEKAYEDAKFHVLYYMLFPTVEINANQEPTVDDEGNYVYVSEEEKAEILAQAEEALGKLRQGISYEEVAKEYGVTDYSGERAGFIGVYNDEMNEMLAALEDGECTEVMDDTLGYSIIVMVSSDDEEMRASYIQTLVTQNLSTEYEQEEQMWLASIEIDVENDMEGTIWQDFDMAALVADMEKVGVIGGN